MSLIDLDRPPARRRPGRLLAAVAVLAVGAVLGGAATSYREYRARSSEISVLVLADTGPQSNDAGVGAVVVRGKVVDASLTRRVTLVNAGPLPVNVHNLSAVRYGLVVQGVERKRWIKHGQSVQAEADIRVVCAGGLPFGRLPVTLAVQTYDEREHTAVAVLDATQWNEQARLACDRDLL
ncbi:hypothetical protein [Couchioplanes caeruleus]|uniref:Uncharacterized protein n=2 Tax=Couchioplanes caeruleus TaxID=56438 RepID=A0A1K0FDV7_9ACTN|nr:hypothetical protein [Couchioplanes caeruleus]OJF11023.1 hypothetical protein BG844_28770 [Couchioplanes caeruleus subsp. caeruleus]ROP30392.1 hypothetical protein EDD30_3237 [Couchioplanes caeruleus]